jgi:UDP-N-acetylmuramate dehydrogenase
VNFVPQAFELRTDVPLAPCCTLQLGGPARYFAEVASEDALREALAWAHARALPIALLGGGSNVVVPDEGFDGLVIRLALRGVEVRAGAVASVTAAAGEPWDALVARTVDEGLAGLECLSGIPGSTGATPIQNVGAYGQEVSETIAAVRVLDRRTLQVHTLSNAECGFAYRDSAFKRGEGTAAGAVVLGVTFALRPGGAPAVRYPELARALAARGLAKPTLSDVRRVVIELRRSKSMVLDPADENHRSAGSFFTNPIVSVNDAARVVERALSRGVARDPAEVPRFDAGPDRVKLAAAWLIERAGFRKGERRSAVGISSRHALALVHHGGGTTAALLDLAREIRERVQEVWGVELSLEPVVLAP